MSHAGSIFLQGGVHQDGGQFWYDREDDFSSQPVLLADYGDIADHDLDGAKLARECFAKDHPEHCIKE